MKFEKALTALKEGSLVTRHIWKGFSGRDSFLFLVPGSSFKVNKAPLLGIYPEGRVVDYHPHIDLKNSGGKVMPWSATQEDLLAEDWIILSEGE